MRAPCVLSPRADKLVQYFDVSTLDFKRNPNKEALKQNNNSVYKEAYEKLVKLEEIPVKYDDITDYVQSCESLYNSHRQKSEAQNIQLKQLGTFSKLQQKNARKCVENMVATVLMNYDKKVHYKKQQYLSFMTLTLPIKQRHTDKVFRKLLVRMIENLVKTYKVKYYLWRAEPQANGNIHFHVLLDRFVFYKKVNQLWCRQLEKLGYISEYQKSKNTTELPPATEIRSLRSVKNTANYILTYMTKPEQGKRAILGQLFGASNLTKKLEYPKFYDTDKAFRSLKAMIDKKEVTPVLIDEFFSVFKGKVFDLIKTKYFNLWRLIKEHYKNINSYTIESFKQWADNPIVSTEKSYTKSLDELIRSQNENQRALSNKAALQKFKKDYLRTYDPYKANQFDIFAPL